MDQVKARIVRIARVLRIAAVVAKVLVIVLMVVTVLQIGAAFSLNTPALSGVFAGADLTVDQIESVLGRSALFDSLFKAANLGAMEPVYRKAIELFITFLTLLVTLFFISFARKLIDHIIAEGKPFSMEAARRIRRASYGLLILALMNPVLGLLAFLLVRFFSLVFEYGAFLQDKAEETTHIQEEIILSFAEITENKSGQTGQHIRRVSEYSKALAKAMAWSDADTENLRLASIMHDIGKLLVPSAILEKPARLTDEEFAEIKMQTTYGGQLLDHVEGDVMELARQVALQHHERSDGKGYPAGLAGDDIGLAGRIVAVADVYDALTSKRSYKDAWKPSDAYDEIVKNAGTQFDAQVVEAFKRVYPEIDAIRQKYADAA